MGVLAPHPARCARHPLPAVRGEGFFLARAASLYPSPPRERGRGQGEGVPFHPLPARWGVRLGWAFWPLTRLAALATLSPLVRGEGFFLARAADLYPSPPRQRGRGQGEGVPSPLSPLGEA